jgi:hypothetical protein
MKTNKGWIIGLAATGVALAGAIVFLTTTKTGKKTMKKWGIKGKKITERAEDTIKDAKKKFANLKEELVCKDEAVVTQAYE